MKATIDLEKVYDQVIYNIFSKIDGTEDSKKTYKNPKYGSVSEHGATKG